MDIDMSLDTVSVDPMATEAGVESTVESVEGVVTDEAMTAGGVATDESSYQGYVSPDGAVSYVSPTQTSQIESIIQKAEGRAYDSPFPMEMFYDSYGMEDPMLSMYTEIGRGIYKAALKDGTPSGAVPIKKLEQGGMKPMSPNVSSVVGGIRAAKAETPTITTAPIFTSAPVIAPTSSFTMGGDGGMIQ